MLQWLRFWRKPPSRPRSNGRRFRPVLEPLEERWALAGGFLQTNLVSDLPGVAAVTDPNLINPWGVAANSGGAFWIADNQAGVSTIYDNQGRPLSQAPLAIAGPGGGGTAGEPTAVILNDGPGFAISEDGKVGPSLFLFATQQGGIAGWNPAVDPAHAILAVDDSSSQAIFTGLAVASNASGTFLYAADFQGGAVDVFDDHFHQVHLSGSFSDPALPAGFAPFGIQKIGDKLFVTYARQNPDGSEDAGSGNGVIDVFDTSGHLLQRLASGGVLNSPWGIALAPAGFGAFSNDLLVGNEGNGRINAFDPTSGAFLGVLQDGAGQPIIDAGLWSLQFGKGKDADTLFFTAGGGQQQHGLFAALQPAAGAGTVADGAPENLFDLLAGSSGDSYPLPPVNGPVLRADAGVQVQPGPAPAAFPVRTPDASSGLALVTFTPGRNGLAGINSRVGDGGGTDTDGKLTAATTALFVPVSSNPATGGRVDGLPADDSSALDLVLEVSRSWDSVEAAKTVGMPASLPTLAADDTLPPLDEGRGKFSLEGLAVAPETQPHETVEAGAGAETAPTAGRQEAGSASLGWARSLVVFFLSYLFVLTSKGGFSRGQPHDSAGD